MRSLCIPEIVFKSKYERRKIYLLIYLGHLICLVQKPIGKRFNSLAFFGVIKTLTARLLNQRNKMPVVDVQIYPSSFDICSYLLLKTISGMHNERASYLGFRETFAALLVLNFWLREFPLSAATNCFEFRCQQKHFMLLCYKICPCCYT